MSSNENCLSLNISEKEERIKQFPKPTIQRWRSFAFTLRPSGGVTEIDIALFIKFVHRYCLFVHVVTEKTGDGRHLHAACFVNNPTFCGHFKQRPFYKMWLESNPLWQNRKRCIVAKSMYNEDWLMYLQKGDSTVVIMDNMKGWKKSDWLHDIPVKNRKPVFSNSIIKRLYKNYEELHMELNLPYPIKYNDDYEVIITRNEVAYFLNCCWYRDLWTPFMTPKKNEEFEEFFFRYVNRLPYCVSAERKRKREINMYLSVHHRMKHHECYNKSITYHPSTDAMTTSDI